MANPLLSDRDVSFLLHDVLRVEELCALPAFAAHSRETFDLFLGSVRQVARDVLFPTYRAMDAAPPRFEEGRVKAHPVLRELWKELAELGIVVAARPEEVGGQAVPQAVYCIAQAYLMAANGPGYGYTALTGGAAHLLETFGDEWVRREIMTPMYAGKWAGTMALTEPQAGSSLADVRTRARPTPGGHYLLDGSKVFISGGDQDVTENVVHLALARIEGAPAGIKGVSLFCVPRLRPESQEAGAKLVDNDCVTAGVFHKLGQRGLASIALNFGERGDCHGYLVGEVNRGIAHMFQMMNEARLAIGMNGVATAYVAYLEALEYAKGRPQGRALGTRDATAPQVPIIEHADVRRMLLRQKAIVEGGLALIATTSRYSDVATHSADEEERRRSALLVDLLTPIAKTFPAERGFEANTLAVQIHGGYGYTSEYLPEAWLRDQKLNSIHEGTSGIQALDLLGRKVVAQGGAALVALGEEVAKTTARARAADVPSAWCDALDAAAPTIAELTMHLGQLGLEGDREGMVLHASDFLDLVATVVLAWLWLEQAAAAREVLAKGAGARDFYEGKLCAAQYWFATEVPRMAHLADRCRGGDDSFRRVQADWL